MMLCSNSEDMEIKLMLDDAYDILTVVSTRPEGRVAMCTNHTVCALCKAVANHCHRMSVVFVASVVNSVNCLISLLCNSVKRILPCHFVSASLTALLSLINQ